MVWKFLAIIVCLCAVWNMFHPALAILITIFLSAWLFGSKG